MWKKLKFILLCASLTFAAAISSQGSQSQDSTNADDINIRLKGVDGKIYDVAKMPGEVVLVSFGATWCKPCEWELAALVELKKEYQGRPVKFFWVSIESEDEKSDILLREYAQSQGLTFPVLRDPNRAAFAQFSERVRLPMVVFFNQQGRFVAPKHTGMSRQVEEYKNVIRSRLDALLAQTGSNSATNGK